MPTILVVDDEQSILRSIERLFADDESYEVLTTISTSRAMEFLEKRKNQIDLVISDERMPELSGSEFLSLVREKYPKVLRIILTGYADQAATIKAINDAQVFRYISKPWDPAELLATVRDAVEIKKLKDRNDELSLKVLGQKNELEKMNAELEKTVAVRTEQLRRSLEAIKLRNNQLSQQRQGTISLLTAILSTHDPIKAGVSTRIGETWTQITMAANMAPNDDALAAAQLSAWILDPGLPYLELLSSIDGFEVTTQFLTLARENLNGSGPKKLKGDQIPLESRLIRIIHDHFALNPGREAISRQFILSRCLTIYDGELAKIFYSTIPTESGQSLVEVPVEHLLEGMRLANDVRLSNGAILLANGTILNDRIISQLKRIRNLLSQAMITIDTLAQENSFNV